MANPCYNFDLGPPDKRLKLDNVYGDDSNALLSPQLDNDSLQFLTAGTNNEKLSNPSLSEDVYSEEVEEVESGVEDVSNDSDIIVVHMDIREPLTTLRSLLQKKVNMDLTLFCFTLQQNQHLESSKTLVDQCIQGEGIVQINVKIVESTKPKTIDIIDVLKPDDDYSQDLQENEEDSPPVAMSTNEHRLRYEKAIQEAKEGANLPNGWIQDIDFSYKLIRFHIPINPTEWDPGHVKHWLIWAVREFNLVGINLQDWSNMPGYLLCAMTHKEFRRRVPNDPGDLFWQHCQILKIHKTVAVLAKTKGTDSKPVEVVKETSTSAEEHQKEEEQEDETEVYSVDDDSSNSDETSSQQSQCPSTNNSTPSYLNMGDERYTEPGCSKSFENLKEFQHFRIADNKYYGATSLWQFLLELLIDWRHRDCIRWTGNDGEFRMVQPDVVAKMWGIRKNKPTMNYDKLARALRYYYDGDMIAKVHGLKFVYKFVCDLKFLLGYTAKELNDRVIKAEKKFKSKQTKRNKSEINQDETGSSQNKYLVNTS